MGRYVQGSEALTRRMKAMPPVVRQLLNLALARAAQEITTDADALARTSRRSGVLIQPIDHMHGRIVRDQPTYVGLSPAHTV